MLGEVQKGLSFEACQGRCVATADCHYMSYVFPETAKSECSLWSRCGVYCIADHCWNWWVTHEYTARPSGVRWNRTACDALPEGPGRHPPAPVPPPTPPSPSPPPSPPPPIPGALHRVLLTEAAERDGAVCLDGSAPSYFWRDGFGSGAKSWMLFLEGGGWCAGTADQLPIFANGGGGMDSCYSRSKGPLGNGNGPDSYPLSSTEGHAWLSPDPLINPRFYNWNMAYAHYCDGGSFAGNRSEPLVVPAGPNPPDWCHKPEGCPPTNHSEFTLYFRGARVFEAMVANITAPTSEGGKGMGEGKEAILAGCSAGGLGVYLHCDAFADLIHPQRASCLADAGYFANIPSAFANLSLTVPPIVNPQHSLIEYEYSWIFREMAASNGRLGVNQQCLKALGRDNPLCFFPEHNLAYTKTPLFMLQSGYDQWHTRNIWFSIVSGQFECTPTRLQKQACLLEPGWTPCIQDVSACNASELVLVQGKHAEFVQKLAPMLDPSTPHGGYVYSHSGHCASGGNVNGTSQARIADWYDKTGLFDSKHVDPPFSKTGDVLPRAG